MLGVTKRSLSELRFTGRQSQCLSMYCCDGLSQEQIGKRLGIAQRVVSQHIAAARAKIERRGLAQPGVHRERSSDSVNVSPMTMDTMDILKVRYIW